MSYGKIERKGTNFPRLYLALYHLAAKIFPNTEFRATFDDPNVLIANLYKERKRQEYRREHMTDEEIDIKNQSVLIRLIAN